jgi:hypothetical protein
MRFTARVICLSFCAVAVTLCLGMNVHAAGQTLIKTGDSFPTLLVPAPENPALAAYLGVPEGKSFAIKDIQADLVLVEIMNVYCASCWKQVPAYNKLYEVIESRPELRDRIKMVAFGAGNKDWEAKYFMEKFEVPFPVIPDPDFAMHGAIGGSKTPFSIFVRQDPSEKTGIVADTHLGFTREHEEVLAKMESILQLNVAAIREKGKKAEVEIVEVKPVQPEEELQARIKTAFSEEGGHVERFEVVTLEGSGPVYTGHVQSDGRTTRLFAKVISQPPPCDVCHDIHFIYIFDATGKIRQFIPLQLTKYGNKHFNEADIAKMEKRIVGAYVYNPFPFDAKVDSVSRATITCAVIFKSLNEGQVLFKELEEKGLI